MSKTVSEFRAKQAELADVIAETSKTSLQPSAFFVSWNGVLTIAYSGFPEPLAKLKAEMNLQFPNLPPENSGSKWPKTSLAALRDGIQLQQNDVAILQKICSDASAGLENDNVLVDEIKIVTFACRSLEKIVTAESISLSGDERNSDVTEVEKQKVKKVLSEGDDPNYWQHVLRPGSRETHYRGEALGCTVMVPLLRENASDESGKPQILQQIARLKQEIDKTFPDYYQWFGESSLHITLRAIS